ncbi:MAG TPA: FHA domain-containing protein [Polyangia bacterium]|nr:FHA domain-containing protein [Polyangia bacterium]
MPQPAVLHIIGGNDRGKAYELVLPETRIGRGADQDLVLADIAVSRRHITIHAELGRYRLQDLGSGNGTLLNGARIDSVILNDGDQVELGNTLMRFDHQPSRQPQAAPSAIGPPPPAPPPPYPSVAAPPHVPSMNAAYTPAPPPMQPPSIYGDTPSQVPAVLSASGPMRPMTPLAHAETMPMPAALAPLGVANNRLIAFGVMGFLALTSIIVIITKSAFSKPIVVASDTEELYRQGVKLFAAKDYEGAKVAFTDALTSAPESGDVKRYIVACDTEVHARGAMQAAERAAASHRYAEAVKALDAVDSDALVHDDAIRRRKELAPKAAADDVEEARGLQTEDPDTARARLTQALALDPGNPEARALAGKLHVELPPLPANTVVTTPLQQPTTPAVAPTPVAPVVREPTPAPPVKAAPVKAAPATKKGRGAAAALKDDDDFAPVKAGKGAAAREAAPSSAQAMAAYKARDFATAERLFRLEARNQPAKQMEKTIAFANQVRDLKGVVDRAAADEAKNPTAAIKDYDDAIAIDARVGKGMHGAYFRQRMGKLQLPVAQAAFAAGRYEAAFAAALSAQRAGAGDGGVLRALDAKAKELTDKGVAVQKTQPAQAKTYWRQVIKMVPTTSPTYIRAYGLINQAGGGHRDEDED